MVSTFQDEERGFVLNLSQDELARVDEFRQREERPPLKVTPGVPFLLPGNNREGFWGLTASEEQAIDVLDCLQVVEPDRQQAMETDHSVGHAKYLPEGLHVVNMNVQYEDVPEWRGVDHALRRRAHHENCGLEAKRG